MKEENILSYNNSYFYQHSFIITITTEGNEKELMEGWKAYKLYTSVHTAS